MKKTLKSFMAVLLAVLMVAFSVPFTASAAMKGKYQPDFKLQFGTFYDANEADELWTRKDLSSSPDFSYSGLFNAPVEYDRKNGTLTLKKDKANKAAKYFEDADDPDDDGMYDLDEDYEYGVGDYFTLTFTLANMKAINFADIQIDYSDSIEPACVYKYKSGTKTKYGLATYSEWLDISQDSSYKSSSLVYGGLEAYQDQSCSELIDGLCDTGDLSTVKLAPGTSSRPVRDNCIFIDAMEDDGGDSVSLENVHNDGFCNPETGELTDDGYTYNYNDGVPLETFIFKIVKDGPITFKNSDPFRTFYDGFMTGTVVGNFQDGMDPSKYGATYAVNRYVPGVPNDIKWDWPDSNPENPGSAQISFFGENENWEKSSTKYTVKFKNFAGDIVSTTEYDENTKASDVTVPANTAMTFDKDQHTTYTWPAINDVTADVTYEETSTSEANVYDKVETIKEATCHEKGLVKYTCTACGYSYTEETPMLEHQWVTESKTPATIKNPEILHQKCSVCGDTQDVEGAPALGATIKVIASDCGTITGLKYGKNTLEYGTDFTMTASPLEGAEFIGWNVNGKLVSKDATYSATALTNMVIEPLFQEVQQNTITVTFYDKYANVVEGYYNFEPADFQKYMARQIPVAPTYNGYTFKGWSYTDDQLKALDTSASVWAMYDKNEDLGFTVTANGAEITLPEGIENGSIPYDTQVTVSAEGATSWKIGDSTVAYGDSYTFFVGSDVTVTPSFEEVVKTVPTATMISTTPVDGSYKFEFLSTRMIPDGYTELNSGYVYGKDVDTANLDIDHVGVANADGNVVKVAYTNTATSKQSYLSYGLKNKDGVAYARAFVIYKDATGQVSVAYSQIAQGTYNVE